MGASWGAFAACVAWEAALLWVPGYLLLRGARVRRCTALLCAPVVPTALYALVGTVYGKLGVFATWANVAALVLALSLAAFAAGCLYGRVRRGAARDFLAFSVKLPDAAEGAADAEVGASGGDGGAGVDALPRFLRSGFDAKSAALYLAAGLAAAVLFTALSLESAAGFAQSFDSMHHLGMIRVFVDSGCWSALDVATYAPELRAGFMPIAGWGFYPVAWHCLAAFSASALGVPVEVAANATNFVFEGLVYPAGMCVLMRAVFRDNPRAQAWGALAAVSFMSFPWQMVNWGPLYPNLAAFSLMPPVVAFFMALFREGAPRAERALAALLFVLGVAALALAQPNAVFTAAVLLIPYCVVSARRVPALVGSRADTRRRRNVASVAALAAIVCVWVAVFNLPFLHDVVWHVWPAYTDAPKALGNVLLLSFRETLPQWLLAALVLAGAASALRDARYRWLLAAYVLMGVVYFVTLVTDGVLKQLLSGFWYTDAARLGASMALYAVPLASLGMASASTWAREALDVWAARVGRGGAGAFARRLARCAPAVLVAVFLVANFRPVTEGPLRSAFGDLAQSTRHAYSLASDNIMSPDELDFTRRAAAVTGTDVVLNMPDDGSVYAFALCGIETYYRYSGPCGKSDETPESRVVREGLCRAATDADVRAAIEGIGARWLLLLDAGDPQLECSPHLFTFEADQWRGVSSVDDETPGFESAMAEGDMRLYRIV